MRTESVTRRVHHGGVRKVASLAGSQRVRERYPAPPPTRVPSDGQTSGFQPEDGCSIHLTRSTTSTLRAIADCNPARAGATPADVSTSPSGGPRRAPPKGPGRVRLAAERRSTLAMNALDGLRTLRTFVRSGSIPTMASAGQPEMAARSHKPGRRGATPRPATTQRNRAIRRVP